jgi:hypothetical protein
MVSCVCLNLCVCLCLYVCVRSEFPRNSVFSQGSRGQGVCASGGSRICALNHVVNVCNPEHADVRMYAFMAVSKHTMGRTLPQIFMFLYMFLYMFLCKGVMATSTYAYCIVSECWCSCLAHKYLNICKSAMEYITETFPGPVHGGDSWRAHHICSV